MYFDEMKIGMTKKTAPAVIDKEKMLAFAWDGITGAQVSTNANVRNTAINRFITKSSKHP